ncbi:MAG: pseudouridine synthase [Hyphomicrobiaceae bacterium]|nr:pseudouridine synthase [Hyphomicrobiaceae bacterium]
MTAPPMPQRMRLDRLLANMGYGSRKDIAALVKAGRIHLDGAAVKDADAHVPVAPELSARLTILGQPLDPPPGLILMLHKPVGVTCSHKEAGPLVYDLLPARWRLRKPAISTIGRLDKDTSGLLLLTDDGGYLHRVIAPKSNVTKRYRATLARPLRGDEAAILASGTLMLEGEDKPLLPVAMELADDTPPATPTVLVTLTEGRYHQVRRMFAALGNHVTALHRDRVGGLTLPGDLTAGAWRLLGPADTAAVTAAPAAGP